MKNRIFNLFLFIFLFQVIFNQLSIAEDKVLYVSDILAFYDQYNGKKVTIEGSYFCAFEVCSISDKSGSISLDNLDDSISFSDIDKLPMGYSRIQGTFKSGRGGYLNMCDGKLINITFIKSLKQRSTNISENFYYNLKGIVIKKSGALAYFEDPYGKIYVLKEGHVFHGLVPKKVKKIQKDRVVFEEILTNKHGIFTRKFIVSLIKK